MFSFITNKVNIINHCKLSRSISDQVRDSNDNLVGFNNLCEQLEVEFVANVKKRKFNNVSNTQDPGYSSKESMNIGGVRKYAKIVPYTEDRNINISFGNNRYHAIGATDGHGKSPRMSILASGSFPIYLNCNLSKNHGDMELSLMQTFEQIDELSKKKGGISETTLTSNEKGGKSKITLTGGTTLSVCVIDKLLNKAYVANLGDSVTQIFRKNSNNKFESIFRTVDHDAANVEEQIRILSKFSSTKFEPRSGSNGKGSLYAKYDCNEIMVVGGFGDFKYPEGFIRRNPDISVIDLQKDDVIICSSDGYYESYNIDAHLLNSCRNEKEISDDLDLLFSKDNYDSSNLATDLMEYHLEHIVDIYSEVYKDYPRDLLYKNVKDNRDNNVITTYVVNKNITHNNE